MEQHQVSPIPQGYHSLTPYLIVKNAREAIEFYRDVFGATELYRMDGPNNKIGHCELQIGDSRIMLADEFPDMNSIAPSSGGQSFSLVLYVKNVDQVFERAVAKGSVVIQPLENKFYGDRMGTIQDPFGHSWNIGMHVEDVTPEEINRRAKASMN